VIETPRLVLRGWETRDLDPFAAMCADAEVMRHLNGVVDRAAAAVIVARLTAALADTGLTFWAIERREDRAFLGFCGLRHGGHPGTPVADELEVGWRLARAHWGRGYAREAAQASLNHGWATTERDRIAAWTVPANTASWGLMKRLCMTARADLDFDHPLFEAGHSLRRHVVYAIERPRD
jgi:RimJ/RimL family protein N-acetyltransferase